MKKIVVTLLLGLFAFPAAFALDGNEIDRELLKEGIPAWEIVGLDKSAPFLPCVVV